MATALTLGSLELTPLFDGHFRLDGGAMFGVVPKPLWRRRAPADERNRILLACGRCSSRGAKTLLIDGGIGNKMDAKSVDIYGDRSHASISDVAGASAGLAGSDIDIVLASHLHFDHVGGFTARDGDGATAGLPERPLRRAHGRVGGRDASPRTQPGELSARRTSCHSRTPVCSISWTTTPRSCRASGCGGPAGTPCTTRW